MPNTNMNTNTQIIDCEHVKHIKVHLVNHYINLKYLFLNFVNGKYTYVSRVSNSNEMPA